MRNSMTEPMGCADVMERARNDAILSACINVNTDRDGHVNWNQAMMRAVCCLSDNLKKANDQLVEIHRLKIFDRHGKVQDGP